MGTMTATQSAILVSVLTLFSKSLGFLREIMIASRFGSGMETDTYFMAMTATVIVVGALGAALNTTLIPIFSEIEERYGKNGKLHYLNNILNIIGLATILMMLIGYVFSPTIVRILAKGFEGEQFDLAVRLNRIGLPLIMFLALTHVLTGLLHSSKIFGPSAVAGIPYNIVFLVYLGIFAKNPRIEQLMIVTVVATFFQLATHLPATRKMGYKFKPNVNFKDPFVRKALVLLLPVLLGSAVQQVNLIIDKRLASTLVKGSISALTYSSRINDMVIAVFIMAITTVVFPMLAEAFAKEDNRQIKTILGDGVGIILLITIPATIGIILLAKPLVYIFFERKAFDAEATLMTSRALIFYSVGLIGASLRLLLNKVYYSLQDTVTPMLNGIAAVVLNVILNFILIGPMGYGGLALATSISTTVTSVFLLVNLRKKIGPIGMKSMIVGFIKKLIAALVMGLAVYLVYYRLGLRFTGKLMTLITFVVSVLVGIITYFAMCKLLRVKELKILFHKIKNR